IPAPAPGVPWPSFFETVRAHPETYRCGNGYLREVEEIHANQLALASGLAPSSIRGRTQVGGTRKIVVLTGKFSDSGADPILTSDLQTELFAPFWPPGP